MRAWQRRTLIVIGSLTVIAAGAYYWLIVESHSPADAHYAFDIAEVRRLAQSMEGDKPVVIEFEQVAAGRFPATAVVAGDGWKKVDMPMYSYRAVYPDSAIIIDTALDQTIAGEELTFDAAAYARMQQAMTQARQIVITHEHMDHIGGLAVHPQLQDVLQSARLNREQISNPDLMLPAQFPDGALTGYQPLEYEQYHALAPGIVLIRARGHTPGSQMVYVQTASAVEFLFIGDVAWHFRNIETQRERARLVTWLFLKEDRNAVFGQLAALKQLHATEPRVHIIPGHDGAVIDALARTGALKPQFSAEFADALATHAPPPI